MSESRKNKNNNDEQNKKRLFFVFEEILDKAMSTVAF